jgi:hypothetical protein
VNVVNNTQIKKTAIKVCFFIQRQHLKLPHKLEIMVSLRLNFMWTHCGSQELDR